MEQALRFNEGKPQWSLVDFDSLRPMVEVLEYGCKKYDRDNWKLQCDDPRQHLQSGMRHLIELFKGDEHDPESRKRHIGHLMANCMMYAYHTKDVPREIPKNDENSMTYDQFREELDRVMKTKPEELRVGQATMLFLRKIWPQEWDRIIYLTTEGYVSNLDCFSNDANIPRLLSHLKKQWINHPN